jgi:PKD repeat protein
MFEPVVKEDYTMKPCGFFPIAVLLIIFFLVAPAFAGPYAPAAGQSGSGAIHMDDPRFVAWATGWQNYIIGNGDAGNGHQWVDETWQTPDKALGKAVGSSYDIVTLGRSGSITMTFDKPIVDGDGPDFAVFENSFSDTFLELGYVEVSTDGVTWHRFQNSSLTTDPVGGYGTVDPTSVYQLGCKYKQGYGEQYDLAQLMLGDDIEINYVRIIDVVGDGNSYDTNNHVIYDAYPTWGSAGFDLDAIGIIHQKVYIGSAASFTVAPANGTAPLTVQFTDTSTGDIDAWNWDFGDGESSTEENPSHTYQEPGDYTVVLEVSGPGGSDTSTMIKVVQVQGEVPTAAFTFIPGSGTVPLTVQFTDTSTGEISSWVWDFGDGVNNVVGQNPSHTYQDSGTYTVILSIDGPYGGDQLTKNACVTVSAGIVAPTASFTVDPASGTASLSVQFTDTSMGDIDSWSWDFGDGESSTEENPSHTYQEPGDYTVTLIVLGPGERVSKTTQGIKVEAVPADQPELAAPVTALAATTFEAGVTLVNPGDTQVIVSAGPIYLYPVIQVDAADRGQSATMFMYVYLPDSNVGSTLGQKSITLGDTVDFAQMLPQSIDLTGYEGQVFDIYCAYILNDETIKYNAYEVRVQ